MLKLKSQVKKTHKHQMKELKDVTLVGPQSGNQKRGGVGKGTVVLFWAVPLHSLWDFRAWVQSMFEDLAVGAWSPAYWTTREFPMDSFILRLV